MEVYEDIARLANELGRSPDFVLAVCSWLSGFSGFCLAMLIAYLRR